MIALNLYEASDGPGDYVRVARLVVNDDRSYDLDDPDQHFMLEQVPVPVRDATGVVRRVFFHDDPAAWARNAVALFRSRWIAEIETDTGTPA